MRVPTPRTMWLPASLLSVAIAFAWSAQGTAEAAGNPNKLQDIEKLVSISENTRGALDKAHRKLDAAVEAYAALQAADGESAKKLYGKFKNAAEEFRKQANEAGDKIVKAVRKSEDFFRDWEQDEAAMTDDRRRDRSARRRAAARAAFQQHIDAFQEVNGIFLPAVTVLSEQVAFLKDNYGARTAPSVSEGYARVVKLADDIYWQVDNAIAKSEVLK